jgi:transposase
MMPQRNKGLKAVLCQAAWAARKTKGTRLSSFFYRVQKRRGQKKVTVATAHLLLRIICHMIKERSSYFEMGSEYLPNQTGKVDYLVKKLEAEGFTATLKPQENTA